MTLRTLDDSRRLASVIDDRTSLVVVGGGFIGSEVASTARSLGATVTVLEALPVPLGRVLGSRSARPARHFTNFTASTCRQVPACRASPRRTVPVVALDDGSTLEADVVVVGIGIVPTTDWLEGSGLEIDERGRRRLDAARDRRRARSRRRRALARLQDATTVRAEHWTNAAEQGAAAGAQPSRRARLCRALRPRPLHMVRPVRREDPGVGRSPAR